MGPIRLAGEITLRSKKELIEQFIDTTLPFVTDTDDIPQAFEDFVEQQREKAFGQFCAEENLYPDKLHKVLGDYLFTQIDPQPDAIINMLKEKPKILQRKNILERIIRKMKDFVETYISGVGE